MALSWPRRLAKREFSISDYPQARGTGCVIGSEAAAGEDPLTRRVSLSLSLHPGNWVKWRENEAEPEKCNFRQLFPRKYSPSPVGPRSYCQRRKNGVILFFAPYIFSTASVIRLTLSTYPLLFRFSFFATNPRLDEDARCVKNFSRCINTPAHYVSKRKSYEMLARECNLHFPSFLLLFSAMFRAWNFQFSRQHVVRKICNENEKCRNYRTSNDFSRVHVGSVPLVFQSDKT